MTRQSTSREFMVYLWLGATACLSLTTTAKAQAPLYSSLPRKNIESYETYEQRHPYYFKYCATTKYHPHRGHGFEGGITGHTAFYLKGVCKAENLGASMLKMCPKSKDYSDRELGTGISVASLALR